MACARAGLVCLICAMAAIPLFAADEFTVVANPSVPGTQIRRADLASVFLGQAARWGDRQMAVPVDQSMQSEVRAAFSEKALKMSAAGVLQYWRDQIPKGRRPPAVKSSDSEVLAFVAANEGAVGYVSRQATLTAGVKAINIVE